MNKIILTNDESDPVVAWLKLNKKIPIKNLDEINWSDLNKFEFINRICTLDTYDFYNGDQNVHRVDLLKNLYLDKRFERNRFSLCSRIPHILLQHQLVRILNIINLVPIRWATSDYEFSFSFKVPYELLLKERGKVDNFGNIKLSTSYRDFDYFFVLSIDSFNKFSVNLSSKDKLIIINFIKKLKICWGTDFLEVVFLKINSEYLYFYSNTNLRLSIHNDEFTDFVNNSLQVKFEEYQ
jgi:hypothetical protein